MRNFFTRIVEKVRKVFMNQVLDEAVAESDSVKELAAKLFGLWVQSLTDKISASNG